MTTSKAKPLKATQTVVETVDNSLGESVKKLALGDTEPTDNEKPVLQEIARLMKTPAYLNRDDGGHQAAVQKVANLWTLVSGKR